MRWAGRPTLVEVVMAGTATRGNEIGFRDEAAERGSL